MSGTASAHLHRLFVCALGALALCLVACSTGATSSLPAGTYSSPAYHFKVSYPSGWAANAKTQAGATAPLILIITRTGARASGQLISSLTVDVLSLNAIGGAAAVSQALAQDKTLKPMNINGISAYYDQATQQASQGNTKQYTVTHSDYYLIHGDYEYQISTDALGNDQATLTTMVQSFSVI